MLFTVGSNLSEMIVDRHHIKDQAMVSSRSQPILDSADHGHRTKLLIERRDSAGKSSVINVETTDAISGSAQAAAM
jgi:hypothetical protein